MLNFNYDFCIEKILKGFNDYRIINIEYADDVALQHISMPTEESVSE